MKFSSAIFLPLILNKCSHIVGKSNENNPPDIMLTPDENQIIASIKEGLKKIDELVNREGAKLRIGFNSENGFKVLNFSFVANESASYKHLRILDETTEKAVNLVWGSKNLCPSVKFTNDFGQTLNIQGRELEISFADVLSDWERLGKDDLFILGVKILAIWLGASLSKLIISAIAFLAFNIMVLGLVIVSGMILLSILKWIIEKTGWTSEDVKAWVQATIEEIIKVINEVFQFLQRLM